MPEGGDPRRDPKIPRYTPPHVIGRDISHFRVTSKLGEGGMGEVYLATDTRLGREVAIKVLPDGFADDADRVARFEREARVLASLNHPNIAGIHQVEEADGVSFLVMEMAPGETLAERVARGPMPLDEVRAIALQIASALEAAHDNGVVHRDLKPANVKVDADGTVKVLDFGLAKAVDTGLESQRTEQLTQSPTITAMSVNSGALIGTAAYMSPEQARGLNADRQSDVWAFGVVLWEMLTGHRPFGGETVTDLLTAILHKDPDWKRVAGLPAEVRQVLRRCLEKEKPDRLRSVGDAGLLLRDAQGKDEPTSATVGPGAIRTWLPWGLAAASIAALVAMLAGGAESDRGTPIARVLAAVQLTDIPGQQFSPSLSPGSDQFVFSSRDGLDTDIFLQRVGGENPVNLTPDYGDDDFQPALSPDGSQVAFVSRREGGGIFVMGATGESPRIVSDEGFDPAWSPDGKHLVYTTERVQDPYRRAGAAHLWTVELATRERRQLGEIDAAGPAWSPSGKRIAFWTHTATVEGQRDIWTMAADGTDPLPVMEDVATDWDPFWSPDGRWLYFISDRDGLPNVWRVPIDESTGRVTGDLQPVTAGVSNVMEASMAADGSGLAVNIGRTTGEISVAPFDPEAERVLDTPLPLVTSANPFYQSDISKDCEWLAYRSSLPTEALYVMRADGSQRRRILEDEHRNRGPRWSPDGRWLSFYSNRSGTYETWAIRPNGSGLRQLSDTEGVMVEAQWTSDGRQLLTVLAESPHTVTMDIGPEGMDAVTEPLPVNQIPNAFRMTSTELSPDDRWLAGLGLHSSGEFTFSVAEVGAVRGTQPQDAQGRPYRSTLEAPGWLDERRVVFWDRDRLRAILWDVEQSQARQIPGLPGPAEYKFCDQGTRVVITRQPAESDLWLMTLSGG